MEKNVYSTSTVKFNRVKFHSGTSTQAVHSAPTLSHTVVGWHIP